MNWGRAILIGIICASLTSGCIYLSGMYTVPNAIHDCLGINLSPEQVRAINLKFFIGPRTALIFASYIVFLVTYNHFAGIKK